MRAGASRFGVVAVSMGLLIAPAACQPSAENPDPRGPRFIGVPLTVGVVGDSGPLAPVAARAGEWEQTRGGSLSFRKEPLTPAEAASVDVILFAGEDLGDLVDQAALAVLPRDLTDPPRPAPTEEPGAGPEVKSLASDDPVQFDRVTPPYREAVIHYGEDRYALPLGGSALVLAYHRAALDHAGEDLASEARDAGIALVPPTTWDELDRLARFLHGRDWDGDGEPEAGLAIPLGADAQEGVGLDLLLSRTASLALHRDYYSFLFDSDSMSPRVASPAFVEALEGLARLQDAGPEGMAGFDAPAARAAFLDGKVAFLIDRAERIHAWGSRGDENSIGVAPLPGSRRVLHPDRNEWIDEETINRPVYLPRGGGWLVGVSAGSKQPEAARDLARYLAESETAERLDDDPAWPMLPVRGDLIGQGPPDPRGVNAVDRRAWSDAVSRTFTAERVVPGLRIPDARGYLADLDQARVEASGGKPAEAVLARVATEWSERTSRLGTERQLWHYRRGLLGFSTSAQPPPRPAEPGAQRPDR